MRTLKAIAVSVALACSGLAHASGGITTDENGNILVGFGSSVAVGVTNSISFGSSTTESNVADMGGRVLGNIGEAIHGNDLVSVSQLDNSVSLLEYRVAELEGALLNDDKGYHGASGPEGVPEAASFRAASLMYAMMPFSSPAGGARNSAGVSHADVDDLFNDAVSQSKGYTDRRAQDLEEKLSAGIAAAAAQPMMPGLAPGEIAVAMGTGHYNGKNALGIAAGYSPVANVIWSAGIAASDTAGQSVLNASISRRF